MSDDLNDLQLSIEQIKPQHLKRAKEEPAYYAEKFLGFVPHWYQVEPLNDPYRFKILTMGRQLGKCQIGSDHVFGENFERIRVDELQDGDRIMNFDGEQINISEPISVERNGKREVFKLTSASGREITVTKNHPFLTQRGYIRLDELDMENDKLAMLRHIKLQGEKILSDDEIEFLGFMIGDGHMDTGKFFNSDKEILRHFTSLVDDYKLYKNDKKVDHIKVYSSDSKRELIDKLKLRDKKSNDKFIPPEIFSSTTEQIAKFISRLIDTDGYIAQYNNGAGIIEYCSKSRQLIDDLSYLFTRLGMYGKVYTKKNEIYDTEFYYISFTSSLNLRNAKKYLSLTPRKQEILDSINLKYKDHIDTFPLSKDVLKDIRQHYNDISLREIGRRIGKERFRIEYDMTYDTYSKLVKEFPLISPMNENIFWDRIISIERIGIEETYAIEVPRTHNYVSNGFITHNTFTLALKASHLLNLFPGSKVAITAQNENRAFEIYNMVKMMQMRHPLFASQLQPKNDKKSEMILDNGSVVKYYAVGTEGKSIRGDTLDLLLMDEADYVPDVVFTATLPTVSATGGEIIMASTPNKPYSMFHQIFTDAMDARDKFNGTKPLEKDEKPYEKPVGRKYGFAAYHYPYTVGLDVTNRETGRPQTDLQVVNILKEKDYFMFQREYLAQWSDEVGTFIPLEKLVAQIKTKQFKIKGATHVMGLDFGRMHDYTALVVYEINDNRDAAVVVDSFRIRRNDWKLIFQMIIKYLKKWQVSELYYDANNVGDVIGNWLRSLERYGFDIMLVPIKFTIQTKVKMFNNLKMGITTGRVFFIDEAGQNEILLKELREIQAEETTSGLMKIHAPETAGKFDDMADAAALGAQAISIPSDYGDRAPIDIVPNAGFDPNEEYGFDDDFVDVIDESDFGSDFSGSFEPTYEF